MSDDPSKPESTAPETTAKAEERAEQAAAIRRRWITLGEVLGVIAVVISGLTLWNNWTERHDTEAVKTADAQRASSRAATLVLLTNDADKSRLALKPASADQSVQSQTIAFPSALDVTPAQTTGEPRIEAGWFEDALKKARDAAKLPDDSRGDERLPVVITTRFLADGHAHDDVAIYDIGYSISGRWLAGHTVTLRGVSLVSRVTTANAKAKLDARWAALMPPKAKNPS